MKKSDAEAVIAYVEGVTRVAYSGSTYDHEAMKFKAAVMEVPPPPAEPTACPACRARGIQASECARWALPHFVDEGGPISWTKTGTVATPLPLWHKREDVINSAWALVYGTEKTLADRVLALKAALIALERGTP